MNANEREFLSIGNPVSLSVPHFLQECPVVPSVHFLLFSKSFKIEIVIFAIFAGENRRTWRVLPVRQFQI
jgi:hypothetical protein